MVTLTPRGWILSCYAKQLALCFVEWVDVGICCLVDGLRWEVVEQIILHSLFCQIEVHTVFLLGHEQKSFAPNPLLMSQASLA